MEKQIFIPKQNNNVIDITLNKFYTSFEKQSLFQKLMVIGLVNQQLGLKANCKEITFVEYVDEINLMDETRKGYLVTYLESEMQFTESDIAYYRMIAEDLTAEN